MNTEPKKTSSILDPELSQALKQTPHRFWKRISHNWGWKLLSALLAICLWAGLITQDPNLTRERRFTNVPISINGQETLLNNGLIVLSGLEEEALMMDFFRAQVPQRSYDVVNASNFNPRIDLSRITQTGEQTVRVLFTTSSTYGTVEGASPAELTITVDEYVTNYRVPVTLNTSGEYPEGFHAAAPIIEPSTIAVSGPKSLVDRVVAVQADYDLSSLSARAGTTRLALPLKFIDVDGNVLESSLLTAASANTVLRTIGVEQRLYTSKQLDVTYYAMLTGQPAKGYEVKEVTAVPSRLTAAGDPAILATIDAIFTDAPVSVEGAEESFATDVRLRKPGELTYLSANTVTVYVEIGPVITGKDFSNLRITLRNVPENLRASLDRNVTGLTITGPQLVLESLRSKNITLSVNAEGLTAGEHTVPVEVTVDNEHAEEFQYSFTNSTVVLTLSEK